MSSNPPPINCELISQCFTERAEPSGKMILNGSLQEEMNERGIEEDTKVVESALEARSEEYAVEE